MQTLLVVIIVAAAIGFMGRRLYRQVKREAEPSCGCGCSGCGAAQSQACPGPDTK
jgi:hypothetical protein